jgi:DNA polymerase-3 subunit gamma/tau
MALYRRYRPATFAEVRGQEHVTEPLRQALRSGRVHHAYLFSGPRGCGKTSSARILARSLNCEQGPTPDPCGKCASCVALAPTGPGSIDVIEIDAASHGGVDDARDLRERAFYAPVSGRFKIYIVDEAHMVTREGFNALLKLVEEPPPHLKFVFATTEPEKVIATIRSRTHHYPFRLMPPAVLRGLLEEILASEGVAYEPAVLPVVIRAGAGSARDALSVLDQLLAGADEAGLTYERAVALLGYTDDSLLDEVTDAFATGDGAAVFHAVDRVVEGGHDPRRFAADLLDRFRDLIVLAAVPDAGQTGLLDIPADRLDRMRDQAAGIGQAQLTRAAETISAGLVEMRGATSPRLLLELMCAQVLLPPPDAEVQALTARLDRLERRIGSGDADDAAPRLASHPHPAEAAPAGPASRPAARTADAPGGSVGPTARPAAAAMADEGNSRETGSGAQSGPAAGSPGGTGARRTAERTDQAAAASRPAGSGEADAGSILERWDAILEAVMRERKVAWILLRGATVDSLAGGVLTLRFAREGDAKGFAGGGHDRALAQVLQEMLGISPQIRSVVGAADGAAAAAGPRGRAGAAAARGPETEASERGGQSAGDRQAAAWPGRDERAGAASAESRGQPPRPRAGDATSADAQPGAEQSGAARSGGGQPGAEQSGGGHPGDGQPGMARSASARSGGPQPGAARSASARSASPQADGIRPGGSAGFRQGEPDGLHPGGDFDADALTGADLIQRELGGQVIGETGGD